MFVASFTLHLSHDLYSLLLVAWVCLQAAPDGQSDPDVVQGSGSATNIEMLEGIPAVDLAGSVAPKGIPPVFDSPWDGVPSLPSDYLFAGRESVCDEDGLEQASPSIEGSVPEVDRSGELVFFSDASTARDRTHAIGGGEALQSWPLIGEVSRAKKGGWLRPFRRHFGCDYGLGAERVMFAPLVVEPAIGTSAVSFLVRSDQGLSTPNRLEYLWASGAQAPGLPERRVDWLDSVIRLDVGNSKLLMMTEYTFRQLNPNANPNTAGFGDMVVGTKALVVDSARTKVSSVFRTYLKTGPSTRGLGTGHISLEPGVLVRQEINKRTFLHGELKYWIPIGGGENAGEVFKAGVAISTVWRESDRSALMPTLEFSSLSFLSGGKNDRFGIEQHVDGEFAAEIYPGLRWVSSVKGSSGLFELGFGPGFVLMDDDWFDRRLLFEMRLVR